MSNGATNKKWYEKTGLVTGIGVVIGIVIGLARNDLPFGIVTGFFLGLGVVVGAVGSKWYKRRGDGSDRCAGCAGHDQLGRADAGGTRSGGRG